MATAVEVYVLLNRRLCAPEPHRQAEMVRSWWKSALLEFGPDSEFVLPVPDTLLRQTWERVMAEHLPELDE